MISRCESRALSYRSMSARPEAVKSVTVRRMPVLEVPHRSTGKGIQGILHPAPDVRPQEFASLVTSNESGGSKFSIKGVQCGDLVGSQSPTIEDEYEGVVPRPVRWRPIHGQEAATSEIEPQFLADFAASRLQGGLVRLSHAAGQIPVRLVRRINEQQPP